MCFVRFHRYISICNIDYNVEFEIFCFNSDCDDASVRPNTHVYTYINRSIECANKHKTHSIFPIHSMSVSLVIYIYYVIILLFGKFVDTCILEKERGGAVVCMCTRAFSSLNVMFSRL